MDQTENNVQTLYSMGFVDIEEIRNALRMSQNDLSEAVAILTNDQVRYGPYTSAGTSEDVEMKDVTSTALVPTAAPPPYNSLPDAKPCSPKPDYGNSAFPQANLYELEQRVFVDQWSIPYKKDESLAKCLIAATNLAKEGQCESNSDCRNFMESCMPECFRKLLTALAVRNWQPDVQEGVYNMLMLLIDLTVERLSYNPIPEKLLSVVLTMAFDPEAEFHVKNKSRLSTLEQGLVVYAKSRVSLDPYGWLLDVINKFGSRGGFDKILAKFGENLTANEMAALLNPLAVCAQFLNPDTTCSLLSPCMNKAISYIKGLTDDDLKNKNIGSVTELLKAVKMLCVYLWPQEIASTSTLCLDVILRMLKCSHFNARMNGLKELIKLIDDCSATGASSKAAIDAEQLQNWMAENNVLSITLESNIDQAQYMDKIKSIIEFVGQRLSIEELTKIWSMQDRQNCQVVDNIHGIMAAASTKFSQQQFDHLLTLISKAWRGSSDITWRRLLTFIGKLGKESNQGKVSTKLLDLLWELLHLNSLPQAHVEQFVEEFFSILSEMGNRDSAKRQYVARCVDDIKKNMCVIPALKMLRHISGAKGSTGSKGPPYKQDKFIFSELNRSHEVVKLVSTSLATCHRDAVKLANGKTALPLVLVDGIYSHKEEAFSAMK